MKTVIQIFLQQYLPSIQQWWWDYQSWGQIIFA